MKQFKTICRKNRGPLALGLIFNIATSFAMVYAGYSLSFLLNPHDSAAGLLGTFLRVLATWLTAVGLLYANNRMQAKVVGRMRNDLRLGIARKIASLPYADFEDADSGHYVSWLTNDVSQISEQTFDALFGFVTELATTLFSLFALFYLSAYIGIAAVVLFAAISILPQLTGKGLEKRNAERSKAQELGTEAFKDVIMGCPIFLLSNTLRNVEAKIAAASDKLEQTTYRYNCRRFAVRTFVTGLSVVGQVIMLLVTVWAALQGFAPAGAALSVGNLSGSFFNSAGSVVQAYVTMKASRALWRKFEVTEDSGAQKLPMAEDKEIQLENVVFGYGEKTVLNIPALRLQIDGKYAVVGESGSGKTTLARLLMGLLPGYAGSVRYGGRELKQIALPELYGEIAYVDQKVYLFQDTVRFNVTLGEEHSDEEIRAVLRKCHILDFAESLPQGLDTVIAENGKNMSGGQRQRLALARALIRNVRCVILDEGTSALDAANAADIERSLIMEPGMGVILITHNLRDTVKAKLDAVYRMEDGAIRHEAA